MESFSKAPAKTTANQTSEQRLKALGDESYSLKELIEQKSVKLK